MKMFVMLAAGLLSVFSLKYLTRPVTMSEAEQILREIPSQNLYATCGAGSHGGDRDPVGGKKS